MGIKCFLKPLPTEPCPFFVKALFETSASVKISLIDACLCTSPQWGEHKFLKHILLSLLDMQVVSVNLLCAPGKKDYNCNLPCTQVSRLCPLLVQYDLEQPANPCGASGATHHPCSTLSFFFEITESWLFGSL